MRGHGCDGLVETIETVVSVVWCERRKATERRRKARWDLENFHQVPEPVGRHRTPDPVGRITCYSTRVWALRWARLRRARRGDRDGGIGCLVRATQADRAQGRRRKARWDLENFHKVPEPVGRHRTPDPVGRITCYSTRVWALRWARLRRARRDDRDGGIGYLVRATEADRAQGRRRKARWDLENFHQVPEPVGRT